MMPRSPVDHHHCSAPGFIFYLFSVLSLIIAPAAAARAAAGANDHDTTGISTRFNQALSFGDAFSVIWGDVRLHDRASVQLKLDKNSGSGFVSLENYLYAYYSASIKLPPDYTAGVVLAFYTSNGDEYPHSHDELDFEFLGNVKGKPWRMQTNIYGNGSVSRGREERFNFWFDPTAHFHNYSILWNQKHIVFMVDNIPIREMRKSEELGGDYPSKPMALYVTLWDGSPWATNGGKYPVNYKYAPFMATLQNLKMEGCATNPELLQELEMGVDLSGTTSSTAAAGSKHCQVDDNPVEAPDMWVLTPDERRSMEWVRRHHMYYSYCQDKSRYQDPSSQSLPECSSQAHVKLTKSRGGYNTNKAHRRISSGTK